MAYESVCSLARGHVIRVWICLYPDDFLQTLGDKLVGIIRTNDLRKIPPSNTCLLMYVHQSRIYKED